MGDVYLVAGLGNPGPGYAATRHNVGFLTVDELLDRLGGRFRRSRKHHALVAEVRDGDTRLILAEPQTFMNESGRSVAALQSFYKLEPAELIVVHDELDLSFGVVRVKLGGGTAGHNGLNSIARSIGRDFIRVRVGIGRPSGRKDPVDFVLEPFTKREREAVPELVGRAADAVITVVREGVAAAQTSFNQRVEPSRLDP